MTSALSFGFFARYRTALDHGMHENELVYVYFGRLESEPKPDPAEVADIALLSCEEISGRIERDPVVRITGSSIIFTPTAPRSPGWRRRRHGSSGRSSLIPACRHRP